MPTIRFGRNRNNCNEPQTTVGDEVRRNMTFWGMVGVVMAALRLKDKMDDYNRIPSDEEEGLTGNRNVALPGSPDRDDDDITLHGADSIADTGRPKRKRSRRCCGCCGYKCGLFWKAVGIVLLISLIWNGIKFAKWMLTPSPTGLEDMPAYSSSLGCVNAPHLFDAAATSFEVPADPNGNHELEIRGIAVGTVVVAAGDEGLQSVRYEMTLRSDNQTRANLFNLDYPEEETPARSRLRLSTDAMSSPSSCMRYDLKVFLPTSLNKFEISSRSTTQLKFDEAAPPNLDKLFTTFYYMDDRNMVLLNDKLQAGTLGIRANRGWVVGSLALGEQTTIDTQSGDAVTNVKVHPAPLDGAPTVQLTTSTGAGRTDVVFSANKGAPHRNIKSSHTSSRNGDLYLTYKDSEYNGLVDMEARSYSVRNVQGRVGGPRLIPAPGVPVSGEDDRAWVGDKEGPDRLKITSKGWVGLYF